MATTGLHRRRIASETMGTHSLPSASLRGKPEIRPFTPETRDWVFPGGVQAGRRTLRNDRARPRWTRPGPGTRQLGGLLLVVVDFLEVGIDHVVVLGLRTVAAGRATGPALA